MGEKDATEKLLFAWDDVFADIVNVLLFGGEELVLEDALRTETARSTYKFEDRLHEQERDVSKFWLRNNVRIALLGLENQTDIDRDMPLRVLGYDGASYRGQLLADEAGMPRVRYPVVTLVLYFGEKPWAGPRSLFECLDIDERIRPWCNDYKINVFDIPRLPNETIEKFRSDFRYVAALFANISSLEGVPLSEANVRHAHEFLQLFKSISGSQGDNLDILTPSDTGEVRMETFFDRLAAKARSEGIDIGMNKGIDIGMHRGIDIGMDKGIGIGMDKGIGIGRSLNQIDNIRSLMRNTSMSIDKAMDALSVPLQERENLRRQVESHGGNAESAPSP